MPAVDLVLEAIGAVVKIKGVLEQFRRNNDECRTIYALLDTVSADLMLLKGAPIMEDERLHPIMERLKHTLERTEAELRKCETSNALVRFFTTDDVAAKLDQLRQDISEKMLGLVLACSVSTNTLVDGIGNEKFELLSQEMDRTTYVAVAALLLPLETKIERLEQRITDSTHSARNRNRTETEKTGVLKYSWSVLEASLASNEDIGGGGISTIHKGELNKIPVAIKKFGNVVNRSVRERFVDELRLVSKLQHRNVIELLGHCYEYNESLVQEDNYIRVNENGHLGFVIRYMPNQSLVRIIKGNESVDWPCLFRIIQGIAKGLHYLHEQGVVHLDLKPKTILLDADMTPKINDFGTARELASGADEITLDATDKPGTQGYMAPELLSLDKPTASTKSDVYSFGVILLETIALMCATSEKGRPKGPQEWLNRTQGTELRDLFDRQLVDDDLLMVATRCVLVGLMCCLPDPAGRPSMHQVVDMLGDQQKQSTNVPSSSSSTGLASSTRMRVTEMEMDEEVDWRHDFCWTCGEESHWPVSCDEARAWLDKNRSQAAAAAWLDDEALLEKALSDTEELKISWLENMAAELGVAVTELGFLTRAYEEIAERRRIVRWMHAYGYYHLDPEREGDKCELFHRLLEDAVDVLKRLQACAAMEERLTLFAAEVEAMSEAYWAYKTTLMGLTRETRQHFDKLVRAVNTNFQDY